MSGKDKLDVISDQVEGVKITMQENIEAALGTEEDLKNLQQQAAEAKQEASKFKKGATKVKREMWYKNAKMQVLLAVVVLLIIAAIAAVIWVNVN